jgi:predicted secreted Zn-dependent protease
MSAPGSRSPHRLHASGARAPAPPCYALLLALLVGPLPLAQAVQKCVSAAGKVTYSDNPCPPGTKGSTVRGTAPAASAPKASAASGVQPAVANAARRTDARKASPTAAMAGGREGGPVEIRYYDVGGRDHESLLASLKAGGSHGRGEWSLTYRYQPRRAGKACSIARLDTTLKQVMTLPRWSPAPGASRRLVSAWARYVAGTRRHAEGHLEIGRDMQEAFRDSLAVTHARCDKLDGSVKSQFARLLEKHRAREKAYDFETAQGRTQGAELTQR